ncbi:MAG: hypothetical protein KBS83_03700 [Lachnospiraceae bacterium]|nr:hypothetical protein [Candidatus Equihabitans merdae]
MSFIDKLKKLLKDAGVGRGIAEGAGRASKALANEQDAKSETHVLEEPETKSEESEH